MSQEYDNESKILIDKNLVCKSDVFPFSETPDEQVFNNFYLFCRKTLDTQDFARKVSPVYFYYKNLFSLNASATRTKENINVISINSGLIQWSLINLWNNKELNDYIYKYFPNISSNLDNPISILNFQIATQFTFYHELAHLIQFSKKDEENTLQENCLIPKEFKTSNHIIELNADSYASIKISDHLRQYFERCFSNKLTKEIYEESLAITICCLFNYLLSFPGSDSSIYFYEKTHPHPYIRLSNIFIRIFHQLNQNPYLKDKGIYIETNKLGRFIIDLYMKMEEDKIFKTSFKTLYEDAYTKQEQIVKYIAEMSEFNTTEYKNAFDN